MYTRYFRKKDPFCKPESIEWIEMSGREYYCFVSNPQNTGRYFMNMGDVVLECTEVEYKKYKAEDDYSSYILKQETGWITQSLEDVAAENNVCREELVADETQDVESEAIRRVEISALRTALSLLDLNSCALFFHRPQDGTGTGRGCRRVTKRDSQAKRKNSKNFESIGCQNSKKFAIDKV